MSVAHIDGDGFAAEDAHDSGLVMYPAGHARSTTADRRDILDHKARLLGGMAVESVEDAIAKRSGPGSKTAADIAELYNIPFEVTGGFA